MRLCVKTLECSNTKKHEKRNIRKCMSLNLSASCKLQKIHFSICTSTFLQILPRMHRLDIKERKILWRKSPMKNDKVQISVFFHYQIIFSHKRKVDGLKKFLKSKCCQFFDLMHFRLPPAFLVEFWKKEACHYQFHLTRAK